MAQYTWTDIANSESALSIRNKLNTSLGILAAHTHTATEVSYDNTISGLTATLVKTAIDEVQANIDTEKARIDTLDATQVSFDPAGLPTTATEVQTAIGDLYTESVETHNVLLTAISPLASQEPTLVDTPIQVSFGAAQGTGVDPVMIDAAGTVTFNESGKYIILIDAHYGRTGASGTSILLFRGMYNGVQYGDTLAATVITSDIILPWNQSIYIDATAGDTMYFQLMRDSAGSNSGGVFQINPTLTGWSNAPCAAMYVIRA